jgi:hypothetical protein
VYFEDIAKAEATLILVDKPLMNLVDYDNLVLVVVVNINLVVAVNICLVVELKVDAEEDEYGDVDVDGIVVGQIELVGLVLESALNKNK